jgi:AcrR family transcriptional regulator
MATVTTGTDPGNRELILDAAAALFVSNGYSATTTRQIAERVGIRQPSLYNHFATKADILVELLTECALPSVTFGAALAGKPMDARDRLLALIDFDLRHLVGGTHDLSALSQLPEIAGDAFSGYRATLAELMGIYCSFLQDAVDAGHFAVRSVALTSAMVFGLVEGVVTLRATVTAEEAVAATFEAIVRVLG